MQFKKISYICTIKINKMSLDTLNKKALVSALVALMLNTQSEKHSELKEKFEEVEGSPSKEDTSVFEDIIPLGPPLTVTISNGKNVSVIVLTLEDVLGEVCGTITGTITDLEEEELTVSDNLLVAFTEMVRNEMLKLKNLII